MDELWEAAICLLCGCQVSSHCPGVLLTHSYALRHHGGTTEEVLFLPLVFFLT